jgi:uncharacterized protein (DUF1330 family)
MSAYWIGEHLITHAAKFDAYLEKAVPMIAKHGGHYLTRAGSHKILEGGYWQPNRVVIIEFPSMEALNAWYYSEEYRPLIELRKESAIDMLITLEGV